VLPRNSSVFLGVALLFCSAVARGQTPPGPVADELQGARALRDEQRYREALLVVEGLDARGDLAARERLEVLRELAFLRLILRDEAGARAALSAASGRDPGFDLGPGDHPPRFTRAFEEARATRAEPAVTLAPPVVRVSGGTATFEVPVERGADAIESIVAYVRAAGAIRFERLVLAGSPARGAVSVPPGALAYYVEALAPSGAVLARAGSVDAPATAVALAPSAPEATPRAPPPRVEVVPRALPRPPERPPSRGGVPAWAWIAGGAVVAAGAATAIVLLVPASAPREGTWGHGELGR
jgi:hypothetical protein